jgi:hypothetical protein
MALMVVVRVCAFRDVMIRGVCDSVHSLGHLVKET